MNCFPRGLLLSAFILVLFTTSCNLPSASPTEVGTMLPSVDVTVTSHPPGTRSNESTPTSLIPVTGADLVTLQCQFCVNNETHAVLIVPEQASFSVAEPLMGVTCLTAQVINGQRILLCRGAQQTAFALNVCDEGSNCGLYPLTLAPCPLKPGGAVLPPPVTLTVVPTTVLPTPVDTRIPRGQLTPLPTRGASTPTAILPLPSVATVTPPPFNPQPGAGTQSPEDFLRWYFNTVWQTRNYEDLWENYLTQNFKVRVGSGIFEDYSGWWNSVERVDVNSVDVIQNDGTHAGVRVNINFHMKDGRVINNQEYEYSLLYDATRNTWMFD